MVQFAFAHVGLGICSADHISVVDQSATTYGGVQTVRSQFAATQSGFASVHGHNLYGLSLRTVCFGNELNYGEEKRAINRLRW